jgi:hypothetical protein
MTADVHSHAHVITHFRSLSSLMLCLAYDLSMSDQKDAGASYSSSYLSNSSAVRWKRSERSRQRC